MIDKNKEAKSHSDPDTLLISLSFLSHINSLILKSQNILTKTKFSKWHYPMKITTPKILISFLFLFLFLVFSFEFWVWVDRVCFPICEVEERRQRFFSYSWEEILWAITWQLWWKDINFVCVFFCFFFFSQNFGFF